MHDLEEKIDSLKNRLDEINGEGLEIKAEMALKNKFISPDKEKELFELVNSSADLYDRYNQGERTEDLLTGLESHCQALEQKRNEIFPDAPKKAEFKLVKKEGEDADNKNKTTPVKKQPLIIRPKRESGKRDLETEPKKEIKAESEISKDLIIRRAAEIKQRRMNNEPGFEGEKIDEILRRQGIEPMTPVAGEFMDEWDRNIAESELRKEERKKERESTDDKNKIIAEKRESLDANVSKRRKKEELVDKLDAAYEKLYSFLNDKKDAPLEVYDSIRDIGNELRSIVRYRGEAGDIAEKIKSKYKKDDRLNEAPKAELSPDKMEIFEKFGQEFYNALKENAFWEGYDEKNKLLTLEIQTKVFLAKQLKKLNLVGEDEIANLVESWVRRISG